MSYMSNKENLDLVEQKITDLYLFLTKEEPTPDDEIEAREELISLFSKFKNLNKDPAKIEIISEIFSDLQEWDTLELWFSETILPDKMANLLNMPQQSEESSEDKFEADKEKKEEIKEKQEIDLTDIFSKVSEQFQGEIEGLKGKIEDLQKQLEKKDEKLRSITEKKKIQKISPRKESRLPPPKIKIPVIKKTILSNQPKIKPSPSKVTIEKKAKPIAHIPEIEKPTQKVINEQLSPIPFVPEIKLPEIEKEELSPIPKTKPQIEPMVIEESQDIPIITEKRKITSVISEKKPEDNKEVKLKPAPFIIEKPKISSVNIEEIEQESLKSTSSDLFSVFSSIGSKTPEKKDQKIELREPEVKSQNSNIYSKKPELHNENKNMTTFVGFNDELSTNQTRSTTPTQDDLGNDKDSLYQELIALEGKRYALEKVYTDLDISYSKGAIADIEFKNQSEKLKYQLDEITSRINSIRRLISSL
jgi:hypothetical protein